MGKRQTYYQESVGRAGLDLDRGKKIFFLSEANHVLGQWRTYINTVFMLKKCILAVNSTCAKVMS